VIKLRFGIDCPSRTLRDIGGMLKRKVQPERIRQMEAKALRMLRHRMWFVEHVQSALGS